MTVQKHYSKAPIVEAAIDLHCKSANEQSMIPLNAFENFWLQNTP